MKIFLGGMLYNGKTRSIIKDSKIKCVNMFNEYPTLETITEEVILRKECDYILYLISPHMCCIATIAEAVDDVNNVPKKVIFCVHTGISRKDFTDEELCSLGTVTALIARRGGTCLFSLEQVANYLNK